MSRQAIIGKFLLADGRIVDALWEFKADLSVVVSSYPAREEILRITDPEMREVLTNWCLLDPKQKS